MSITWSSSAVPSRPSRVASLWSLLVVLTNLVPLLGVLWFDWNAFKIVLCYWLETGVVGFFNVLRMRRAQQASPANSPASIAFFVFHYGGFMAGHLMFIVGFLSAPLDGQWLGLSVAVVLMIVQHAYAYRDFLRTQEYLHVSAHELMFRPYGRIVITHLTIFAGAFGAERMGATKAALIGLVIMKTLLDFVVELWHLPETGFLGRIKAISRAFASTTFVTFMLLMIPVVVVSVPSALIANWFFDGSISWPFWTIGVTAGVALVAGFIAATYEGLKGVPGFGAEPTWWKVALVDGVIALAVFVLVPFGELWAWVRQPPPRAAKTTREFDHRTWPRPETGLGGPDRPNLARTASWSASSYAAANDKEVFEPGRAFDGNLSTRWNSRNGDAANAWLAARWDQPVRIKSFILRQAHNRIAYFTIQNLPPGSTNWADVIDVNAEGHGSWFKLARPNQALYGGDMVHVNGQQLVKWHGKRQFGQQAEGNDHPVFVITLPEPIQTVGVRLNVDRSKQAAVGVFEFELY